VAAHISPSAVWHTVHEGKVTLITDEFDKVARKNQLLCGIFNASYSRELAYVVRVVLRSQKHKGKGNGGQVKYLPLDAVYGPNGLAAGSALGDAEGCAGNGEGEVKSLGARRGAFLLLVSESDGADRAFPRDVGGPLHHHHHATQDAGRKVRTAA
jgi:hypothetical protein